MNRTICLTLVLALLFHARADSQHLTAQRVVPREWITSWLICGPIPLQRYEDPSQSFDHLRGFTTDYLESAGGETNLHVRAGDVVSYKGGTAAWQLYRCPRLHRQPGKGVSGEGLRAGLRLYGSSGRPGWGLVPGPGDG